MKPDFHGWVKATRPHNSNYGRAMVHRVNGIEAFPEGFCQRCGVRLSNRKCRCGIKHSEYNKGSKLCLACEDINRK